MSSEPLELPGDTEFTFFRIHVGAAAAAPRRGATIAGRSSIRSPCGHRRNRTLQFARCTPGESPTKGRFCSGATILRRYAREFCQVLSRLGRSGCPRIRSATYSVHTACAVLADRNAHRDSLTGRPPESVAQCAVGHDVVVCHHRGPQLPPALNLWPDENSWVIRDRLGIGRAVLSSMADLVRERRRTWSKKDRERIAEYERQWLDHPTIREIREQHQDECSQTIQAGKVVRKRKRRISWAVTYR
jgi:hypothetical protein